MEELWATISGLAAALWRVSTLVALSPITLEYAKLFVDLAKSYAWPLTILTVLMAFRNELSALLGRIMEMNFGGNSVRLASPNTAEVLQKKEPSNESLGASNALKELPDVRRSPAQVLIEQRLKDRLAILVADGHLDADDQVDVLLNVLSSLQLKEFSQRMYLSLFGSQLQGLFHLSEQDGSIIEEARTLYEIAKQKDPEFYEDYSFDQWLNFLVRNELVTVQDGVIRITTLGKEFVGYLQALNFDIHKRG